MLRSTNFLLKAGNLQVAAVVPPRTQFSIAVTSALLPSVEVLSAVETLYVDGPTVTVSVCNQFVSYQVLKCKREEDVTGAADPQVALATDLPLVHWIAMVVLSPQASMMEPTYLKSEYKPSMNTLMVFAAGVVPFCLIRRTGYEVASFSNPRGVTSGVKTLPNDGRFAAPIARDIFQVFEGYLRFSD